MRVRGLLVGALLGAGLVGLVASTPSAARPQDSGRLAIFAAASLTGVLPKINANPHYSFAG